MIKRKKLPNLALAVSTLSVLGLGSIEETWAQNNGEEMVMEEVVVSARRRDESLQDVPLTVTSINADSLEARNVTNLRDLNTLVPNITVGAAAGFGGSNSSVFIRGIGQARSASVAEPGVGIYIDGVFLGQADGGLIDLVDVERIEVLKGPQGTLFGKNSIGGLIHYVSKKPSDEFEGSFKTTVGRFNRTDIEGFVNIPLNDSTALRFSALTKNRDGHVTDIFDPTNPVDVGDIGTRAARMQLRHQPSDVLDINLSLDYTKMRTNGTPTSVTAGNPDAFPALVFGPEPGPPIAVGTLGEVGTEPVPEPTGDLFTTRLSADTMTDFTGYGVNLGIEWALSDNTTLKSITAYRTFDNDIVSDFDGSASVLRDERVTRTHDQFQQEFQLLGTLAEERFNYVAGLFFFTKNPTDNRAQQRNTLGGLNSLDFDLETDSYAIYGEGEYSLTDKLSVSAGLRFTEEEGSLNSTRNGTSGSVEEDFSSTDYRISARYRLSDEVMVYSSVATGFKSGGFNDRDPDPSMPFDNLVPYDPETADSFEIGLKGNALDGSLIYNLSAFTTQYEDLQLPQIVPGFEDVVVGNIGEAQIDGIEADFVYGVNENVRLNASIGWMDARITDGRTDDGSENGETPTGTQLGRSPDLSYSIGAEYFTQVENGASWSLRADWGWKDDHRTIPSIANAIPQDAYGLLSARMSYTSADDRWSIAVFGTNLTDETYLVGGLDLFNTPFGATTVEVARPREWGASIKVNF